MNLILLSIFGLSNVLGQQKMFYLKGSAAPYSIYYANLDGTGETLIASGVVSVSNCAGYGGGKICYNSGSQIKIIKTNGTGNIAVPNTTDIGSTGIDLSPDGSKIVYSGSANNYKLFIINTDGTGKITFNNGSGVSQHQSFPTWKEAGKIYFVISNNGDPYSQRIYSKTANDSSVTPTQLTSAFAQYPLSGGTNNRVAFNIQTGPLYVMNSDGSSQIQLSAASTGVNTSGTWHSADSTIFYVNGGNIWKIKMNNIGNTQITSSGNITQVFGIDYVNISDSIYIPDTISHISNTLEIPVRNSTTLTTSNNVISYQFNVTYNAAKMQYISSNLSGTIASGGNVTVNSSTSGKLVISYMKSTPILGKGNILKLKFQPLQIGTSQLAISNFLYNTDTVFNTHTGNYTAIGLYGDIDTNSHVQAYDAALVLQYSVGLDPLPVTAPRPWTNWRYIVANVDGTDTITANDASLILQYSANLISTFPVGAKTMENPTANIIITQENNELVFKSNGDLFGLNVNTINGSNITLSTPTSISSNMLSAFNIAGSTYNIGLCTTNSPTNNTVIMRIPFTCIASDTLTFNMFVNKNSVMQKVYVDKYLGIEKSNQQQINIYPNPATNQINVQINQSLIGSSFAITDQIGKTVLSGKLNTEKSTIEIGDLSGGIYLFSIGNNAKQTFKVIKK